jgi:cytosine/adenosine deaminase-related metal-dependent hydrolase
MQSFGRRRSSRCDEEQEMIAYQCRTLVTMDAEPIADAAFIVDGNRFVQIGGATAILSEFSGKVIDLGDVIVMPGLINAHCHLDYTVMRGAILPAHSFSQWVGRINAMKRSLSDSDYLNSMIQGFSELQSNGVTTVLDIVANPQVFPLLPKPPIRAWFFLELIDVRPRPWIDENAFGSWLFFSENRDWLGGLGLSPHAPYTASAQLYRLSLDCFRKFGMPVTTHLAESSEEMEMFADAGGELYQFLKKIGRPMDDCGRGTPLRHLVQNNLIDHNCIVAHLNEIDAIDLELLSTPEWRTLNIVHCPKSHRFLHHNRFPLEALRDRGLNVSIGTDSLASNDSLNLFSEMRTTRKNYPLLNPKELLEMTTVCPARALRREDSLGKIAPGFLADAISLPFYGKPDEAYEAILENREPIEWMMVNGQLCG